MLRLRLVVLVTNRNGTPRLRSRVRRAGAPGIGAPPVYSVPSRSSSRATGRRAEASDLYSDIFVTPRSTVTMTVSVLLTQVALLARLAAPAPYPFAVGETLSYEARLGYFPIGTATAKV